MHLHLGEGNSCPCCPPGMPWARMLPYGTSALPFQCHFNSASSSISGSGQRWQLIHYVSKEIFWGPSNSQPLQLAREGRETNELASGPDWQPWLLSLGGDSPFVLWWALLCGQFLYLEFLDGFGILGGYNLTHSSRNWDAESCVKGRPHWGSLWKGLNAGFLPVVSTPGSRGLHFSPVNGEIWSQENTSFSFLRNKKSLRTHVMWISQLWAECCTSWLLRCSFLIHSSLSVALLFSASGIHCSGEK